MSAGARRACILAWVVGAFGAGVLGASPAPATAAPAAAAQGARPSRVGRPTARWSWTARVTQEVTATARPGSGPTVGAAGPATPFWGGPDVLLVLGRATHDGRSYLHVLLKRHPAGTTGWIPATAARLKPTDRRLVVDLSARTVTLRERGRVRLRVRAVVGAPATATPTGLFAVDAPVAQPASKHLGTRVLALVAYSRALVRYQDATPQVALHAYEQLGAPLGSAASHGCVRLDARIVRRLIALLPRGAPVRIQR